MPRQNVPLLAFNRGIISPKGLARVDLDRTRLSAERMHNWLPSTLGPMSIRPGTHYMGGSRADTGAEWIEFVASTDDVALLEVTDSVMRFWLGEDSHNLSLLSRPAVDTELSLSDTGWTNASTGGSVGGLSVGSVDLIPAMTGATTNGVTITASSQVSGDGAVAWRAADDDNATLWADTGSGKPSTLPSWLNVDFGAGNAKPVGAYSITAGHQPVSLDNAPNAWRLIGSDFDTGTFATDTGKWTLEDERTGETAWALSERRTYTLTDTGTPGPWRHWRLHVTAVDGGEAVRIAEIAMFEASAAGQSKVTFSSGILTLNATAIGSLAKMTRPRMEVAQ
jgi:hypothetical protein